MRNPSLADRVRPDFPALQREVGGRPAVFFDGPGGSQVPRQVIDAVADYLAHRNANTHGAFPTSMETDRIIAEGREALAALVGGEPGEIVFGANMTSLTYAFARALAREWAPGDEVIVTALDHQANVAPWRQIAGARGMVVRTIPFDPESCTLDYTALEEAIGARPRLVAIGYASNAVGTINDVARAARLARDHGALCYVDAVHYAPHGFIDVAEIGCDFLACSAYKFFGPHIGAVWARREHLEGFEPFKLPPAADTAPERWETGTLSHEGIAGAGAAVSWIAQLAPEPRPSRREAIRQAMTTIRTHEAGLVEQMLDGLRRITGVRVFGPPAGAPRTPTVAFTVAGRSPEQVAQRLAEEGIFVWSGDFYASSVVAGLGLAEQGGLVRAGLAPYSTGEEIARFLAATERIARTAI